MSADDALAALLLRARALYDNSLAAGPVADRLAGSVIRPLVAALNARARAEMPPGDAPAVSDEVEQLALEATRVRVLPDVPVEVLEATAALQDLACSQASPEAAADLIAQFTAIQAALSRSIQCQSNGPYLVTNLTLVNTWLGEAVATRPQMALCRCGQSALKPLCDGSHAQVGFVDAKDPKRVPDRRDTYVGQQVTVLDNRGICQHSGFCTDRLNTVFHTGTEPFVTPSGGRMDEIIRAVRDCPSGALSFALDGHEARDQADWHSSRDPAVEISKDGPYRVTGGIPLLDHDGADEERADGASREHYALCRCGHSQNKPFCSGMHWYVQFKDPVPAADHQLTPFEWCGGLPALTRMTRIFYEKYVPQDPLLAPLFSQMSEDHPQRVARWLAEVFGGPKAYSSAYGGYARMLSQHLGKGLTEERRARWVALITLSAQEAGLPADPEFRAAFGAYIEWGSRLALENSQPGARPPEHMPMPHWDWNTAAGPPGSRISALPGTTPEAVDHPVMAPGPNEPVSYEKHVKGLFRAMDRNSMRFAFDLWSAEDVRKNAQAILERLRAGSMPCDGAWPADRVDVFERWSTTGMQA